MELLGKDVMNIIMSYKKELETTPYTELLEGLKKLPKVPLGERKRAFRIVRDTGICMDWFKDMSLPVTGVDKELSLLDNVMPASLLRDSIENCLTGRLQNKYKGKELTTKEKQLIKKISMKYTKMYKPIIKKKKIEIRNMVKLEKQKIKAQKAAKKAQKAAEKAKKAAKKAADKAKKVAKKAKRTVRKSK